MNIGFVSTWFERGAAYVTKLYVDALIQNNHKVFVYARGGERFAKGDVNWDQDYVTWGMRLSGTNINKNHFYKWIKENNIDTVFFNEQHEFSIVAMLKRDFKNIKIGSYIDYYKENTLDYFNIYDFIICNTKRHYEAFEKHQQKFYIPWGTDIDLFKPIDRQSEPKDQLVFFHSAGMSNRKGTELVIEAFIKGKLNTNSKLIIHSQVDIKKISGYESRELEQYNIEVLEKTVSAPGLYYLGDVYVYPTKLEGLGLTIYEALSCGLPVITTDNAPMNEVVKEDVGKLVEVEKFYSRSDGYYWPLSKCSITDLVNKMRYYIDNYKDIKDFKHMARNYAVEQLNWKDRYHEINNIFETSNICDFEQDLYDRIIKQEKNEKVTHLRLGLNSNNIIGHNIKKVLDKVRG
ncbi:glycosyltransferase family 4 protein [Ornithinibacillus californiensis]|uniref:glycosyltransferase family 4 protein n=1 Tax=Ornithinibacillus californiensis TaxID=161536 RepID=UPI00064DD7DD|nr:glycosyltransferase family 4 protein [Ornithinibacillus californiensis]